MTAAWRALRLSVLSAQQGRCAAPGCSASAKDVVGKGGGHVAFCRSCRLRFDAPTRTAKARHTLLLRREQVSGQTRISGVAQ